MKKIILFLLIIFAFNSNAQENWQFKPPDNSLTCYDVYAPCFNMDTGGIEYPIIQIKDTSEFRLLSRRIYFKNFWNRAAIDNSPKNIAWIDPFTGQIKFSKKDSLSISFGQISNVPSFLLSESQSLGGVGRSITLTGGSVRTIPLPAWDSILFKPSFNSIAFNGISSANVTTALGFTPVTNSRTITINGTSQDLTSNRTWSVGTVTSVAAGTGLSGGTITSTGTISMPNTGTSGTYSSVTTDVQGRVTSGTNRNINDSPGRTLVTTTSSTGFQISSTRDAVVNYEGTFQTTSTIGGPASVTVYLETANTNSTMPSDWTIIAQQTNTNSITLAVVLQQVDIEPWSFSRTIAAGKYVRIRYGNITGTATATINTQQQEVTQ